MLTANKCLTGTLGITETNNMNSNKAVLWKGNSSIFLYFYQYLFFVILGVALYYLNEKLVFIPLLAVISFILDARSMKYTLTTESVYISGSLFDNESETIDLKDIISIYTVYNPPWSYISLGTVILITNYGDELHPCIKAVKDPYKLAKKIEMYALLKGAIISS